MMLQNYTYVDPVMDPVVLLTLLLGLVFLTAAVVVYFTIRSLPSADLPPSAFVPPEADRIVLTPRTPVHAGGPDRPSPRAADRPPERRSVGRASRRVQIPA